MKIMLGNNAGRTQTIYTFHSEEGRVQALQTYFGIRLIREAGVIHEWRTEELYTSYADN